MKEWGTPPVSEDGFPAEKNAKHSQWVEPTLRSRNFLVNPKKLSWFSSIMSAIRRILPALSRLFNSFVRLGAISQCRLSVEAQRHLEELLAAPKYGDPKRLARKEHKVFSQHGEDGIIAEIFRRIGLTDRVFVEVGVAPLENNTLFLLVQGWQGTWLDGSLLPHKLPAFIQEARKSGALRTISQVLTRENVGEVLHSLGLPIEFDLLSLDVDMNTYALWEGLRDFRPRVVVVEYNAFYPFDVDWRVEYQPKATWDGSTYFGASLKAFERLGAEVGYQLVGCDLSGTNAFFVRSDIVGASFLPSGKSEDHYEPARYHLYSEALGRRSGVGPGTIQFGPTTTKI